jgi:hypothetical protein
MQKELIVVSSCTVCSTIFEKVLDIAHILGILVFLDCFRGFQTLSKRFLAYLTFLDDYKLLSIDSIFAILHDLQRYLKFIKIREKRRSSKNPLPICI